MPAVAKKLERSAEVRQCFATVIALAGATWRVRDEDGIELAAKRALGCLVEPQIGDRVLVAHGGHDAFVLAVLERDEVDGVVLSGPGDVTVSAPGGAVRLAARGTVDVISNAAVTVTSPRVAITADEGSVTVRALGYVGEKILAEVDQLRTIARTCDSVLERFTQKVKRSFRFVEESDILQAENINHSAKETYHLRSRNTVVHSQKVVKMDSESIQLG